MTREPIVEGIFYPSAREKLERLVHSLMDESPIPPGASRGIIVPHAGFRYGGRIQASGYKSALARNISQVVIIGPIHRDPGDEVIFPESSFFRMPTGAMEVAVDKVEELAACSTMFLQNDIPHLEEHCLEVQLPFIHVLFPRAKIIPVLVGRINAKTAGSLAGALGIVFAESMENTLFVVTANMSSFVRGEDAKIEAERLSSLIRSCDVPGIYAAASEKTISSCGSTCIAVLLQLLGCSGGISLLSQADSGDVVKNPRQVVEYAAFGIA